MQKNFQAQQRDMKSKHTQLMAAFAELDPDPVFRFDDEGRIIMTNSSGQKLCNDSYAVGMMLEKIIPQVKEVDLKKCIQDGSEINLISQIENKYYMFTIRGIPELGIGQIYGSDITDLKKTQQNLITALNKAEESEKLKSFFLAQMSHEIRSPLTAIMGFNLMIKDYLPKDVPEDLDYAFYAIDRSSRRLTRTIEKLLNMSQLQTGGYEMNIEKFDVAELVKEILTNYEEEAKLNDVEITLEFKTDEFTVTKDKYAIHQILSNIIDNAVKYTKKGTISIQLDRNENDNLFIYVKDSGIGMTDDFIANLFVPFSQEVMGYNRPYDGTGLGLALSKKYADLNNIDLKIESEKNLGTAVTILFK
jgi:signal transduction histidine kinase